MKRILQALGMNIIIRFVTVCFVLIPLLSIQSCQVEDDVLNEVQESVSNEAQLKNATVTSADIDALVHLINSMVVANELESGIANSLLSKLENAKKSLENDKTKTAMNQFYAIVKQLKDLIATEVISEETGGIIISVIDVFTGNWSCGQPFVDPRDGNIYNTVKIGDQCWMAENLAYLPEVSSSSQNSVSEPGYHVYGYGGTDVDEAKATDNYKIYGVLYNWPAAMAACPEGWHLPSDAEWKQLEMVLGMTQSQADAYGWRGTNQGTQLKATSGWFSNGNGTNTSGFSALPGGSRSGSSGAFYGVGFDGYWWSSTVSNSSHACLRGLGWGNAGVGRADGRKGTGFSVRCVRD